MPNSGRTLMHWATLVMSCGFMIACGGQAPGATSPTSSSYGYAPSGGTEIPPGVVYVPASEAVNQDAQRLLETYFVADPPEGAVEALFGVDSQADQDNVVGALICMPFLWKNLKTHPLMQGDRGISITTMIPIYEGGQFVKMMPLQGRSMRTGAELTDLWTALRETVSMQDEPVVRKLNTAEMAHYWALIAWDIDEPIFVVETGSHRILVDFWQTDGGQYQIAVLDDMPADL